jgi:predicted DNA binding protein
MVVILDLTLPADQFELGRILDMEDDSRISLETLVPMGERAVPFFRLYDGSGPAFEEAVRDHQMVKDIQVVNSQDGETLYALDWEVSRDTFFAGLRAADVTVMDATGGTDSWSFELRFPTHEAVSTFQSYCADVDIPIVVDRMYNPTKPEAGPWYGLTPVQRETLTRAVEAGYYSIPRRTSTNELAEAFDISDQAVTERLRRAVITLTRNTLLVGDEMD